MDRITQKIARYRQEGKPHTWRSVLDFIDEMGFSADEYFHLYPASSHHIDQPIWDNQRWVAVFWVVGGSEGNYVHVENRWNDAKGDYADLILLGKFWNWERAETAVRAIQQFVNQF